MGYIHRSAIYGSYIGEIKMNDRIMRKIQKTLADEELNRYDYLLISNYFQRLYIETSVQDNIMRYIDETQSRVTPDKIEIEEEVDDNGSPY